MRKFITTLALATAVFLPVAAHADRVTEDDPRFDCLTMGDQLCGPSLRAEVERRAVEASTDTLRCIVVERVNVAGRVALGIECQPVDPTVHADGTPAPALSPEQDAELRSVKAQPRFTG